MSNVEVRVAVGDTRSRRTNSRDKAADDSRSAVAKLRLGVRTVDSGVPVRIPVVGISTAHTPGLNRANAGSGAEHTVSYGSKANDLVDARQPAAAVHREVLRSQVLEVVAARTIGVDRLHVDHVARTSRDVLDRQ